MPFPDRAAVHMDLAFTLDQQAIDQFERLVLPEPLRPSSTRVRHEYFEIQVAQKIVTGFEAIGNVAGTGWLDGCWKSHSFSEYLPSLVANFDGNAVRARRPHDCQRDAGATYATLLRKRRRQAGDADAGVALEANVEADQQRGDLLQDARIFQFAAVDGAHPGDFRRESSHRLQGGRVIAADDHVAVDDRIAVQDVRGRVVERRHDRNSLGYEFRGLLRRRAFP